MSNFIMVDGLDPIEEMLVGRDTLIFGELGDLGKSTSGATFVITLQNRLKALGEPIKADGIIGPATRAAMENVLRDSGAPPFTGGVTFIPALQKFGGWWATNAKAIAEAFRAAESKKPVKKAGSTMVKVVEEVTETLPEPDAFTKAKSLAVSVKDFVIEHKTKFLIGGLGLAGLLLFLRSRRGI